MHHFKDKPSYAEEQKSAEELRRQEELRQEREEQEQRHKLIRLGKYLQTKTMHVVRRDARAIRREHAERVKQQELEQQKKEAEARRREEDQRRREQQERQRRQKEEQEVRRKQEEERRNAIEEKKREKLQAKALLAQQDAEKQAEEQRKQQEFIEQKRQEMERHEESERLREEQRRVADLRRKEMARARTEQKKEEEARRRERLLSRKQGYSWRAEVEAAQRQRQGEPVEPAQPKTAEKMEDEVQDAATKRRLQIEEQQRKRREEEERRKQQSANSDVDKAVSGNETYEVKKLRLMALARKKREEVAATAKSRLAKMRFSGESDEDSDKVDDFMVSTRRAKEQKEAKDMDKPKEVSKPARHAKGYSQAPVVSDSEEADEEASPEKVDLPAAPAQRAEEPSTELEVGDDCAPSETPDTVDKEEEKAEEAQETDEKEMSKDSEKTESMVSPAQDAKEEPSEQVNAEEPTVTADKLSDSVQPKPPCVEEQVSEPEADAQAEEEEAQSEDEEDASFSEESEEEEDTEEDELEEMGEPATVAEEDEQEEQQQEEEVEALPKPENFNAPSVQVEEPEEDAAEEVKPPEEAKGEEKVHRNQQPEPDAIRTQAPAVRAPSVQAILGAKELLLKSLEQEEWKMLHEAEHVPETRLCRLSGGLSAAVAEPMHSDAAWVVGNAAKRSEAVAWMEACSSDSPNVDVFEVGQGSRKLPAEAEDEVFEIPTSKEMQAEPDDEVFEVQRPQDQEEEVFEVMRADETRPTPADEHIEELHSDSEEELLEADDSAEMRPEAEELDAESEEELVEARGSEERAEAKDEVLEAASSEEKAESKDEVLEVESSEEQAETKEEVMEVEGSEEQAESKDEVMEVQGSEEQVEMEDEALEVESSEEQADTEDELMEVEGPDQHAENRDEVLEVDGSEDQGANKDELMEAEGSEERAERSDEIMEVEGTEEQAENKDDLVEGSEERIQSKDDLMEVEGSEERAETRDEELEVHSEVRAESLDEVPGSQDLQAESQEPVAEAPSFDLETPSAFGGDTLAPAGDNSQEGLRSRLRAFLDQRRQEKEKFRDLGLVEAPDVDQEELRRALSMPRIRTSGLQSFVVLDRRKGIGGMWEPWLQLATPPCQGLSSGELLEYFQEVVTEHRLAQYMRFEQHVRRAEFSSKKARWTLTTATGVSWTCRHVMNCTGYFDLFDPYIPEIPGMADFAGKLVHTHSWPEDWRRDAKSKWRILRGLEPREDMSLEGKRVILVGSGASAVTAAPALAERSQSVVMLQRSPSYIKSAPLRHAPWSAWAIAAWLVKAGGVFRWLGRCLFSLIFRRLRREALGEAKAYNEKRHAWSTGCPEALAARSRESRAAVDAVADRLPELRRHFTPSYQVFEQRTCFAPGDEFFMAIQRGRLSIVTAHIDHFTRTGIRLQRLSQTERRLAESFGEPETPEHLEADVVVLATGHKLSLLGDVGASDILGDVDLLVDGCPQKLGQKMAYQGGLMASDVPNLFNFSGYFKGTYTLRLEAEVPLVLRILQLMDARGFAQVVPRWRGGEEDVDPLELLESKRLEKLALMLSRRERLQELLQGKREELATSGASLERQVGEEESAQRQRLREFLQTRQLAPPDANAREARKKELHESALARLEARKKELHERRKRTEASDGAAAEKEEEARLAAAKAAAAQKEEDRPARFRIASALFCEAPQPNLKSTQYGGVQFQLLGGAHLHQDANAREARKKELHERMKALLQRKRTEASDGVPQEPVAEEAFAKEAAEKAEEQRVAAARAEAAQKAEEERLAQAAAAKAAAEKEEEARLAAAKAAAAQKEEEAGRAIGWLISTSDIADAREARKKELHERMKALLQRKRAEASDDVLQEPVAREAAAKEAGEKAEEQRVAAARAEAAQKAEEEAAANEAAEKEEEARLAAAKAAAAQEEDLAYPREARKKDLHERMNALLQRNRAEEDEEDDEEDEEDEDEDEEEEEEEEEEEDDEEEEMASHEQAENAGTVPTAQSSRTTVQRPLVPDSDDEEDEEESEEEGFMSIMKGLQARRAKPGAADSASSSQVPEPKKAKQPAGKRDEEAELERERKEVARRTLELMEARRMVDAALEGDTGKKKSRKRNYVNKRCSVHLIRQKMDEELAAQERGPRYVNNVAIFVKKGQKDIDANTADVLVKKDEKEKAKKAKEKDEKKSAKASE
eukprot:s1484_g6.t5